MGCMLPRGLSVAKFLGHMDYAPNWHTVNERKR